MMSNVYKVFGTTSAGDMFAVVVAVPTLLAAHEEVIRTRKSCEITQIVKQTPVWIPEKECD